jgi:hypothetical protein
MRHHVEQNAASFAGVVYGHDMRMGEAGGCLDLLEEPFGSQRSSDFGVQDLYRDTSPMTGVERAINCGHPASADLMLDRVAVTKCGLRSWSGQLSVVGETVIFRFGQSDVNLSPASP